MSDIADQRSALDGLTLFRFAHISRDASSGGVETYLDSVNRRLLKRHRMRIIQLYLHAEADGPRPLIDIERVGRGELMWVPSTFRAATLREYGVLRYCWHALRSRRQGRTSVDHSAVMSLIAAHPPSLAVFHWLSIDSPVVAAALRARGVPMAVMHHFNNHRLRVPELAHQLGVFDRLGVVSQTGLPESVRGRAEHLSDGIDTGFFNPAAAMVEPIRDASKAVVLLPSRICRGKGHLDAVTAASGLRQLGADVQLAFAGRNDDSEFAAELRHMIASSAMTQHVVFLGELKPAELRSWYAASHVVILPSDSEGLPRVVLEAQAMGKPVVAYDVGGTSEAMRDGITGHLVPKGQVELLMRRLHDLLRDAPKRSLMGSEGRRWVEQQFSIDALVARHETFYARILGRDKHEHAHAHEHDRVAGPISAVAS